MVMYTKFGKKAIDELKTYDILPGNTTLFQHRSKLKYNLSAGVDFIE